jgi:hypothetical protein
MDQPAQHDLFGGPADRTELVRPAVPDEQLVQVRADCSSVHSRMPPVDRQVALAGRGPLLRPGEDYASAGARYAPVDRLRAPDKLNRDRIAAMIGAGLSSGRDVQSSPRTTRKGRHR